MCVILRQSNTSQHPGGQMKLLCFLYCNDLFKFWLFYWKYVLHFVSLGEIKIKVNILVKDWSSRNGKPHKHDKQNAAYEGTKLTLDFLKIKLEMVFCGLFGKNGKSIGRHVMPSQNKFASRWTVMNHERFLFFSIFSHLR